MSNNNCGDTSFEIEQGGQHIVQQPLSSAPSTDIVHVEPKTEDGVQMSPGAKATKPHIQWLNQLYRNVEANIVWRPSIAEGGNVLFECNMTLAGETFTASASTKKEARVLTAEKVIAAQRPYLDAAIRSGRQISSSFDDRRLGNRWNVADDEAIGERLTQEMEADRELKNPVVALHTFCNHPDKTKRFAVPVYDFPTAEGESTADATGGPIRCTVTLADGRSSEGSGVNKKDAKTEACRAMLIDHLNVDVAILTARDVGQMKINVVETSRGDEGRNYKPRNKNMVAAVNEMFGKLRKIFPQWSMASEEGVGFTATIVYGEEEYSSTAPSAKTAKQQVARHILDTIFGVDVLAMEQALALNMIASPLDTKTSTQLLHEVLSKNGLHRAVFEDLPGEPTTGKTLPRRFRVRLTIGDRVFDVEADGKKSARTLAAVQALEAMFNIRKPSDRSMSVGGKRGGELMTDSPLSKAPRVDCLADSISALVKSTYLDLCIGSGQRPSPFYAAFVLRKMLNHADEFELEVVSLASGGHTMGSLSTNGTSLIDMHPEILAKRALQAYLYTQLAAHLRGDVASAFVKHPTSGVVVLRRGHSLHMYTNMGVQRDTRARAMATEETVDHLRFYEKTGEATSVALLPPQTWTELRTTTEHVRVMCVTDKLMRWGALGVQGALLTHFIGPISIDTITSGCDMDTIGMKRALGGRMVGARPHIDMRVPCIIFPTKCDLLSHRVPSTDVVMTWSLGDDQPEVLSLSSGHTVSSSPSRLCKAAQFTTFHNMAKLHGQMDVKVLGTYVQAKEAARQYATARDMFMDACSSSGLGRWQSKPKECDNFCPSLVTDTKP